MIEIQLKFREEAENARKQENPFYKKLERYRFPRISIGENRDCQAIEIIPKLLSDMGYKNGDMEDWDTISQLLDVIIDRYKLYGQRIRAIPGNMGLSGQVRPQAEREGTGKESAGKVRGGETKLSHPGLLSDLKF